MIKRNNIIFEVRDKYNKLRRSYIQTVKDNII